MIVILMKYLQVSSGLQAKTYLPASAGSVKAIDFFIRSQLPVTLPAL